MPPQRIADLSLREKVGQLFLVGFDGTTLSPPVERFVDEWGLGGVVYFSRNVSTPEQTAALSARLRERAARAGVPPPLVAVDQEGGPVSRLPWGTELPSAMALGATRDASLAEVAGEAVGAELRSLGVDVNLAPVLDVHSDPDNPVVGVRSFGEDPSLAGELGTRFAAGLQSGGVLACGKHFPGHGATETDSHRDLPVVTRDRERLDRVELVPFERAVEAGVDAVMTAHVAFPALTGADDLPATVSRDVVTGVLREDLGFDGLVVTDCLEMDAIADGIGTAEAAVRALEAGCDLLTVSHTPAVQEGAMRAVLDAVRAGRLPEARLDESVARVLRAKRSRDADVGSDTAWETAAERSRDVGAEVATGAVTLVRDATGALPVGDRVVVVTFAGGEPTEVADGRTGSGGLAAAVESPDCAVAASFAGEALLSSDAESPEEKSPIGSTPEAELPDGDTHPLGGDATVVVGTVDAANDAAQANAVRELAARTDDLVVVSLRNPNDLRAFHGVDCYLAAYDSTPATLAAVGAVLRGEVEPRGSLPVTIPLDGDEG
ncbi:MAG: beta-N-acetylhexosaminidase [Haloferacaceae archaeon]